MEIESIEPVREVLIMMESFCSESEMHSCLYRRKISQLLGHWRHGRFNILYLHLGPILAELMLLVLPYL